MIAGLRVGNVRNFAGSDWRFPLTPLVALCGTNSAGKSSLLKTLLLLGESVDARAASGPGTLNFSDGGFDLGGYDALVSGNATALPVNIGVEVILALQPREIAWWIAATGGTKPPHRGTTLIDEDPEERVVFTADWIFTIEQSSGGHCLETAQFSLRTDNEHLGAWKIIRTGAPANETAFRLEMDDGLFAQAFDHYGAHRFAAFAHDGGTVRLGTRMRGLLPDSVLATAPGAAAADAQLLPLPLPPQLNAPLDKVRQVLSRLNYIGPLRTPAERFYLARGGLGTGSDTSGVSVPFVLRDHADEPVVHRPPGRDHRVEESLLTAVNRWLHFLRTGQAAADTEVSDELSVSATRNVLVEVELNDASGSDRYPLADSGFGYSQLLPILLRGLRLEAGATVVVEQPELHLHPALQMRLADFFISMALGGRQVLVETHSEHLVNALRVATAEDATNDLDGLSTLYFIDGATAPPDVHELSISPDGTVPDWPASFFGEALSLSGRLLRAQHRFLKPDPGHPATDN